MIDKAYCMSSYLALRYIANNNKDFFEGIHHKTHPLVDSAQKIPVRTADDIDKAMRNQFLQFADKKKGVLLSGGMDSAIVASYMPGCDAYTFRFLKGDFQTEELKRAEYYAQYYNLHLHYVDIDWEIVQANLDVLMRAKGAPVHSIEPQIYQAAQQAKADGIQLMFIGDGSDYIFGGMDQLLSKDWSFDAFIQRYTFVDPKAVLKDPVSMQPVFEPYRLPNDKIDFQSFMNTVMTIESFNSYFNAFSTAGLPYYDPYSLLEMAEPLDLFRIRHGESKYLIRELMTKRYPHIPVPNKLPMPRPVDIYFENWEGPTRPEFKAHLNMSDFTGNQKWQIYCLERFLNMYDPLNGQRSLCK